MPEPRRAFPGVRLSLAFVRAVRFLVPRGRRAAWLREWEAELRHRSSVLERRGTPFLRRRADLIRRATGALPDAVSLRRRVAADVSVVQDVTHAVRVLQRRPVVSALAVLALALGIGGTVAVFSVVDALLVRALPYRAPGDIVTVWQTERERPEERPGVAPGTFLDWRERSTVFEALAAAEPMSFDFLEALEPMTFIGALVTEGFFEALGAQPVVGRVFRPDEYTEGRSDVVLLSHGTWLRWFGGDPSIVGRHIRLEDRPHLVAGVLPRWFHPDVLRRAREQEIWAPKVIQAWEQTDRRNRFWSAVGRLRPGVSLDQARAELAAISGQLSQEHPRTLGTATGTIVPFRQHLAGPIREPLMVLFAATVLVLLLACANVASLLLARGTERQQEFAVRTALGAGRWRLIRQTLVEGAVLGAIACAMGLIMVHAALRALVPFVSIAVPQLTDLSLDVRLLAFAIAVTAAAALLAGMWPAIQLSRAAPYDGLRDGAAALATTRRRRRAWSVLVVSEVALALTLLAGAGLLVRSLLTVLQVDPGFDRSNIAILQVFASGDRYRSDEQRLAFFDRTLAGLRSVPGVTHAGLVSAMPLLPANIDIRGGFRVEGRPAPPDDELPAMSLSVATADYFRAMQIPLHDGRLFSDGDHGNAPRVAVINDRLADRFWPGESPIDQRITVNWLGRWQTLQIVGVVGGVRHAGLEIEPRPEVFMPLAQVPYGSMTFVVRTAHGAGPVMPALEARIWDVDPTLPLYDTATVDALVSQSVAPRRFLTHVLGTLAGLAFVLAALGVYGVLSVTTAQRTREIGVRMAFGSSRRGILGMVVADGMRLVAAGIVLGLLATLAAARMLGTLLYGIAPTDPLTLGAATLLLAGVALAACLGPALHATRIDPFAALRS